jgi:hypothetical protein
MNPSPEVGAWLARMEASRRETQHYLGVIERQIAKRAERMTITARMKRRRRRRSARAWTCVDECVYQARLADLTLARLPEIERLSRGLARQDAALARMRAQCGLHDAALS